MKLKWVIIAICICIVAVLWEARKKPQVITIRPTPLIGVSVNTFDISNTNPDAYDVMIKPLSMKDGSVLLYGQSARDGNGMVIAKYDGLAILLDKHGKTVWRKRYRTALYDGIYDASQYPNGDIFLFGNLGLSYTDKENPKAVNFRTRLTLSGHQVWMKQQPYKETMTPSILDCSNDGVLMGDLSIWLVDNQGNEKWSCSPKSEYPLHDRYIGRHKGHYRFAVPSTSTNGTDIWCIEDGKLASDSKAIHNFQTNSGANVPESHQIVGISGNGKHDEIVLLNPDTGWRKILSTYPSGMFDYTIRVLGHTKGSFTYLVLRDGSEQGMTTDDPADNTMDRTATVFRYSGGKSQKLFDIYTAPVYGLDHHQPDVIRREDGSFVSVTCFGGGGYGSQYKIGTVIGVFSPSGVKLGEFSTVPKAERATLNTSLNILAGQYEYGGSAFVANLPNISTPIVNPAPGAYSKPQTVIITCATKGATIHYTSDGSEPTSKSTKYAGAIAVDSTMTIKARAFRAGTIPSLRAEAKYRVKTAR